LAFTFIKARRKLEPTGQYQEICAACNILEMHIRGPVTFDTIVKEIPRDGPDNK
jgi:hypothetical protein